MRGKPLNPNEYRRFVIRYNEIRANSIKSAAIEQNKSQNTNIVTKTESINDPKMENIQTVIKPSLTAFIPPAPQTNNRCGKCSRSER